MLPKRTAVAADLYKVTKIGRCAMAQESKVTIAAARFLGKANWPVVSLALPSGGSGVTFRSKDNDGSVLVPDIIAMASDSSRAIIVEAKPAFSASDVAKLLSVRSGIYEESIGKAISLRSGDLILCLAFSGDSDVDYKTLGIDLVLTVFKDKEVKIAFDRLDLFS
jgi:hypothetical protein